MGLLLSDRDLTRALFFFFFFFFFLLRSSSLSSVSLVSLSLFFLDLRSTISFSLLLLLTFFFFLLFLLFFFPWLCWQVSDKSLWKSLNCVKHENKITKKSVLTT